MSHQYGPPQGPPYGGYPPQGPPPGPGYGYPHPPPRPRKTYTGLKVAGAGWNGPGDGARGRTVDIHQELSRAVGRDHPRRAVKVRWRLGTRFPGEAAGGGGDHAGGDPGDGADRAGCGIGLRFGPVARARSEQLVTWWGEKRAPSGSADHARP